MCRAIRAITWAEFRAACAESGLSGREAFGLFASLSRKGRKALEAEEEAKHLARCYEASATLNQM